MSRKDQAGVVDALPEEVQLVTSDGASLQAFIGSLRQFFSTATTLELTATRLLAEMQARIPSMNEGEDTAIQRRVRDASALKKDIEDHWAVTAIAHRFHKRLVAHRARATDPLDQAISIGNTLHNRYAEAERRRAREEEDRLRAEAETRERARREVELRELEVQAVAAEEASTNLSEREQAFVHAYAFSGDGLGSAERAGFKDPYKSSARLLTLEKIRAAVHAARTARALREHAEAKRQMPIEVNVEPVPANIQGNDRTTWSADVTDIMALVNAVCDGRHGIPRDVLTINHTQLNVYARSMKSLLNWPGVQARKTTRIVNS